MTDTDKPTPQATDLGPDANSAAGDTAKDAPAPKRPKAPQQPPGEIGGRDGPEPTRYGDWEVGGRCTDF